MGKRALEGLDGVERVTRGWRGIMEINAVTYDKGKISIEEMEHVLKRAKTYRMTIREE